MFLYHLDIHDIWGNEAVISWIFDRTHPLLQNKTNHIKSWQKLVQYLGNVGDVEEILGEHVVGAADRHSVHDNVRHRVNSLELQANCGLCSQLRTH